MLRRLALGLALAGSACATPPPPATTPTVTRTDEAIDLSGDWNDVDADAVAKALIEDCMTSDWAEAWQKAHGKKAVVRLYPVRNKTDGYIDYRYFTKQLEAALVRSQRVDVVSSLEEAEHTRQERQDQATHASDDSAKSQGNEAGSDFVLDGWILSQIDKAGGKEVRAYLTSLELVETETNKKVWVGQKRIKKLVASPGEGQE